MDSLTPNIFVKDMNATIAFYQLLSFNVVMSVPGKATSFGAMMVCGNVSMMFQTFESPGRRTAEIRRTDGGSLLLYIKIKNIRTFFDTIKEKSMC